MIAYFLLLVVAYECSFTHIKGIVLLTIVLLNPNMFSFESTVDLQKPTDQDPQFFI